MSTIREVDFIGDFHHVELSDDSKLSIGHNVKFRSFTSLEVGSEAVLELSDGVFFNDHCSVRIHNRLSVGQDTMFGDGVRIFDNNHKYSGYSVSKTSFNTAPISIGRDCWIGANTVILKGVTIGDNVIIGANCLIYQDIPSNSIVRCSEKLEIIPRRQAKFHAFTFTFSDQLEELGYLLENLPEVDFHVAAPTNASSYLESFDRFSNFHLYTYIQDWHTPDRLLDDADFYLDINHWGEVDSIVHRAVEKGKPIFAFENVAHYPEVTENIYKVDEKQRMVKDIRRYLQLD